jgi:dipeptidyl aminopeptidase/acylaminoacyl peptidase
MGGHIALRSMVVTDTIRAGVIWAGVVASYPDMLSSWRRPSAGAAAGTPGPSSSRRWGGLLSRLGSPDAAPEAWASISANSFVEDLSGPVQLHHGTADRSVPVAFSETLAAEIGEAGAVAELYLYPGDDHNISANFSTAMQRSVAFMDAHVKAAAARRE